MSRLPFALAVLLGAAAVFRGTTAGLRAQQDPSPAEQKRGNRERATHTPRPNLPPALVLHHVRAGNKAATAALAAGTPMPSPAPRPSGAGRYICAVFVCADADLDVPALLGLQRRDVLVLASPGPFVQPEAIALLEHFVGQERLPLVLILTHERCATIAMPSGKTPRQSALAERVADVQQRARRYGYSMPKALARTQREMVLGASVLLQHSVAADHLRILPAEVDATTGAITWHTTRADELPMPPVK